MARNGPRERAETQVQGVKLLRHLRLPQTRPTALNQQRFSRDANWISWNASGSAGRCSSGRERRRRGRENSASTTRRQMASLRRTSRNSWHVSVRGKALRGVGEAAYLREAAVSQPRQKAENTGRRQRGSVPTRPVLRHRCGILEAAPVRQLGESQGVGEASGRERGGRDSTRRTALLRALENFYFFF